MGRQYVLSEHCATDEEPDRLWLSERSEPPDSLIRERNLI
jgi:hypothetical protein